MKKLAIVTAAAALVLGFGAGQALAADRVVDNDGEVAFIEIDGVPTLFCDLDNPLTLVFTTIQDAISGDDGTISMDPAVPFATIRVCPGVYEENVDVDIPNLILIGLKGDKVQPCITGTEPTQACVFALGGTGSAITISADANGSGFTDDAEPAETVDVIDGKVDCDQDGFIDTTDDCFFDGEDVEDGFVDVDNDGVLGAIDGSDDTTLSFTDLCVINGLVGACGVTVKGIKVTNSGPSPDAGILVQTNNNMVLKITAFDNLGHGIRILGMVNTFDGNNAHDNGMGSEGDGFHDEGGNNTFIDNKAHDNFDDGFHFVVDGNTVNENRARDNVNCGFRGAAIYGTGRNRNRADKNGEDFCADPPSGETGSVKGRVTEIETGAKLEGVLVEADGLLFDATSGNGRYLFKNIPASPPNVTVTATKGGCVDPGGGENSQTVTVVADRSVTADLQLACP